MTTYPKIKTIDELINDFYPERSLEKQNLTIEEYGNGFKDFLKVRIPTRFKEAELTDKNVIKKLEDFTWDKGFYLYGDCGVGKTYQSVGLYKTILGNLQKNENKDLQYSFKDYEDSRTVVFSNFVDFLADLKKQFSDDNSEREISKLIKTNHILFIDDFGTEKITEWTEEVIYRLINHRYEYMKPTFFTSNLSIKELSERVGDRIASRIVEMCEVIKLEGEDRRLR
jgi:DNA replication protein DnaC